MKLILTFFSFLLFQLLCAQTQDKVDFLKAEVDIELFSKKQLISGQVQYKFDVLKDVDSIFLDAVDISFESVTLDSTEIEYSNGPNRLSICKKFKKGNSHTLSLTYLARPKQTVYFLGLYGKRVPNNQIWTQGQGKYTSHWLPSLDDMNDKIEFDLAITYDSNYQVVSNGRLLQKKELGDRSKWFFDMEKPMSSYLVAFAIGNFAKKTIQSSSGVPIELYYEPKDSLKVEPTYRYTKRMFDFLEKEIGVPYPWQNYKQIPVQDFLYAGMENTGATIFSNTFMIDSIAFPDKNYVNVNAHEMAHQWFGNLVTEQSGNHHWLHEGFATYYAYLAEKEVFGEDYVHWKLFETARSLASLSEDGNGEALTNPNAGSITFYEKGAWALTMLKEQIGDEAFKEGIKNYLEKFAFRNVTISDFMWEMRMASGMKLIDFEQKWLQESEFPMETAKSFLGNKSSALRLLFDLEDELESKSVQDVDFGRYWNSSAATLNFQKEIIKRYGQWLPTETLLSVLEGESLELRQAFISSVSNVQSFPAQGMESLLKDKSYITQEAALFKLWSSFPENRTRYLNETENIGGLPNKNVRMLWLALALASPEYRNDQKPTYFKELSGFTHPEYHFEVRLLAFQYLSNLGVYSDEVLKNLVKACNHHVWYFRKSSRKFLKDFLKGDGNQDRLMSIYASLDEQEKQYLDKTLSK